MGYFYYKKIHSSLETTKHLTGFLKVCYCANDTTSNNQIKKKSKL